MFRLRSAKKVSNKQRVPLCDFSKKIFLQRVEKGRIHRNVGFAPPDSIFRLCVFDDELILGRTPRVLTRSNNQWPVGGKNTLAAAHSLFDQRAGKQIPVDGRIRMQSLLSKGESGDSVSH